MSIANSLADIPAALLTVLPQAVYHYIAPDSTAAPYITWAEDGQGDSLHSNNTMTAQAITGAVHLFTRAEYDPLFDKIQKVLRLRQIPYRLNSVQYERDTGLIHYEWVWEVAADS